jgi:hypothetical protein
MGDEMFFMPIVLEGRWVRLEPLSLDHIPNLLLTRAFEVLGTLRVEFKTDVLNQRARAGLLRIGAKAGRAHDTFYYSILDAE